MALESCTAIVNQQALWSEPVRSLADILEARLNQTNMMAQSLSGTRLLLPFRVPWAQVLGCLTCMLESPPASLCGCLACSCESSADNAAVAA